MPSGPRATRSAPGALRSPPDGDARYRGTACTGRAGVAVSRGCGGVEGNVRFGKNNQHPASLAVKGAAGIKPGPQHPLSHSPAARPPDRRGTGVIPPRPWERGQAAGTRHPPKLFAGEQPASPFWVVPPTGCHSHSRSPFKAPHASGFRAGQEAPPLNPVTQRRIIP